MPTSQDQSLRSPHHVTAILVAHDGATWLPEVVASLSKQKRAVDQLIAIDTGSQDGSASLMRNAGIQVIDMPRETGFGAAVNFALQYPLLERAAEGQVEWIWLLHDDCAPAANNLEELLQAITDRPNVAVAGPKLLGWYDRAHLLEVGVSIAPNGSRWTGLEFREQDQGQRDQIREVLAVSTAGALIRRDVFEELGGFDPELTLFRDDVDFGWRVHTSGHSVIVAPKAIAYHAEAAANERRSIDVSDAFLHRPLLLDRRHAAYVLMSNSSFWLTPLIALQILSAALLRAIGFLLAKLPGYALDELAAVALVIAQPQDLIRARRARKATRLLSSREVARFVPPRGAQLAMTFDRARAAISRTWRASALSNTSDTRRSSVIDFSEEIAEEADIELVETPSIWNFLKSRPILTSSILVFLISLLAFRGRFGNLVGGALPESQSSGMDLLRNYADSWHEIGLGSSAGAPPWVAIIGAASFITLFNLKLFTSLLFTLAIPLSFFGAYRLARKFTDLHYLALGAALLYTFTPAALGAVNSGRLGTVTLFIIGPWLVRAILNLENLQSISWRSTWWLAFLLTLVFAFSPITFIVLLLWQLILGIFDLVTFNRQEQLTKEIFDARNLRRIAITAVPVIVCAPWSLEIMLNPARLLLDPGLPYAGGEVTSILLGNPGGLGAPPFWILSPVLLISLIALFIKSTARIGEVALFFMAFAAIFGSRQVSGHGHFYPENLWVGSLLVIPTLLAVLAGVTIADHYVPKISEANIDYRHLLLGGVSIISLVSVVGSIIWWISTASSAPLQSRESSALPAFLSANAQTEDKYKTLVIRSDANRISYFIARDGDLQLGDPDVISGLAPQVNKAIVNLVTGAGIDSSKVLADFGVRYVFLAQPFSEDLVRTVDGVGGFTRSAKTDEGVTWKVSEALALINFRTQSGEWLVLPSDEAGAQGVLTGPGTVVITEKYDGRWRMLLNGKELRVFENENGTPRFEVNEAGDFVIFHDGTSRRAWISWQSISFITLLILALPSRRTRREMRLEELS